MSQPFDYDPLPEGQSRLLSVNGTNSLGQFECKLETKVLNEAPEYYALSYVCGANVTTHTIKCNGQDKPITQSVHEALTGLQRYLTGEKMPIWIDQICINQVDVAEKEREVRHMDGIYRRAKTVLVWLGPGDEDSYQTKAIKQLLVLALARPPYITCDTAPRLERDLSRFGLILAVGSTLISPRSRDLTCLRWQATRRT